MNLCNCSPEMLANALQSHLKANPAERPWRHGFAPQLNYGRHAGPPRADARQAAVAIVLCRTDSQWQLPLTVRAESLPSHAGEVSFPGGQLETGELSPQAARREFIEELLSGEADSSFDLNWVGQLAPLFVFVSNTVVTPWIGILDKPPAWQPNPAEVAHVMNMPLEKLLSDPLLDTIRLQVGDLQFTAPSITLDGHPIWGTTAVLLSELRNRLLELSAQEIN